MSTVDPQIEIRTLLAQVAALEQENRDLKFKIMALTGENLFDPDRNDDPLPGTVPPPS